MADLDDISRLPLRTINADGIPELVMGVTWLLWGILCGIPELVPKGHLWRYYWLIVPFVLMSSGLAGPWITKRLKERFSYSRAGYVELRKPKGGYAWAVIGFVLCTSLVASAFVFNSTSWLDLLPVVVAAVVAGALHFMLRKQAGMGPYLYPLLCLALGAIGLALNLGTEAAFAVLYAGLGVAMTIGGGLRLVRFVRSNEEVDG